MLKRTFIATLVFAACAAAAAGDDAARLPEGPGRELTARVCLACHDSGNFRKARLGAEAWENSVADMVERGAKGTPAEMETIVAYLAANFGKDAAVRINTAPFAEIKTVLGFTVAETRALLAYRDGKGPLRNLEDLRKVPGIDPAKVDARKQRIVF